MTDDTGSTAEEALPAELAGDSLLMRLYDGELEGEELARAEALRGSDGDAADKLASMALVGELLRENVAADERGDSIAAAVMAQIAAGAHEALDDGLQIEDGEGMAPTQAIPQLRGKGRAANDNSRAIFAVAAVAAAVAIGVFSWGGMAPTGPLAEAPSAAGTQSPMSPSKHAVAEVAMKRDATPADPTATANSDIEEYEPTVEVASVDFGSMSGSVFYVPSGEPGAATAVVWVSDLEEEEEL
jgi:negative regulator of sigma E activity